MNIVLPTLLLRSVLEKDGNLKNNLPWGETVPYKSPIKKQGNVARPSGARSCYGWESYHESWSCRRKLWTLSVPIALPRHVSTNALGEPEKFPLVYIKGYNKRGRRWTGLNLNLICIYLTSYKTKTLDLNNEPARKSIPHTGRYSSP